VRDAQDEYSLRFIVEATDHPEITYSITPQSSLIARQRFAQVAGLTSLQNPRLKIGHHALLRHTIQILQFS